MISVNDKNELIYLGIQGEAESRTIEFNFEDWLLQFGSGTLELVAQRNGEKTAYPVELAFYDNVAVWTVSDVDNAKAGVGKCQLRYKIDDVIVKTAIFKTMTDKALGDIDEPGDPYDDIIEKLEDIVAEAEEAAKAVVDLTVDSETLQAGSDASVEKEVDPETGEINLHFGIPTGPRGPKGNKGDTGNGIADAVLNADYTLTLTFTDGTTYTTPSIRGQQGDKGNPGDKGDPGTGIADAVLNADYTLTLTFTDGTTYTTPSIRGQQGDKGNPGDKGDPGTGIASIDLISTVGLVKTYRITYTDGTTYDYQVTDGTQGTPGNGIVSIAKTGTSGLIDIYTITFSDGTTTTFNVTNGQDGDDYILTNQDKADIANLVLAALPVWTGGSY